MALEPVEIREVTQYEYIFVGVDDTDDQSGQTSTADTAQEIARRISEEFDRKINMGITSHSLSADEGMEYTSDNTAMCFDIDLPVGSAARVREIGLEVINAAAAADASPGLCVLAVPMEDDGIGEDMATHAGTRRMTEIKEAYVELIRFGQRAKREPVTEEEALQLAAGFSDLILTAKNEAETASGSRGMIGALAAVGLRIGGDDGMFLGEYDMTGFSARTFGAVAQCIGGFRSYYSIDPVFGDRTGSGLGFHERIVLKDGVKAVLNAGRFTILNKLGGDDMWEPYTKESFGNSSGRKSSCEYFELDPEEEDRFRETKRRSCGSCLFRKLTDKGYVCTAGHTPVK